MSQAENMTTAQFDSEVLQSDLPVLVDFWAPWCGPCRMVGPIIDELASDYQGKIKVYKVNVDEEGDLAQRYQVMTIPTVILFKNGEIAETSIGAKGKEEFAKIIDSAL